MSTEPTNMERAAWAKAALAIFTARTHFGKPLETMDRGDMEAAIGDLIADLLRFARTQEFDTDAIQERANEHFEYEVGVEGRSK